MITILVLEAQGEMVECDVCGHHIIHSSKDNKVYLTTAREKEEVTESRCSTCFKKDKHEYD